MIITTSLMFRNAGNDENGRFDEFYQTDDFYANYIMGWVDLTILPNFSQIYQSTICLVEMTILNAFRDKNGRYLTKFCQTGDLYANYSVGWVELRILTNFCQICQSTICLAEMTILTNCCQILLAGNDVQMLMISGCLLCKLSHPRWP